MRHAVFWKTDWFLGIIVSSLMLLAGNTDLVQSLERKAYDLGMQAIEHAPLEQIAIIAIDDASIANLGRWPWPRDLHAKMNDLLHLGQAKLVANTSFFFEPQIDPGYTYIKRLLALQKQNIPPQHAASGNEESGNSPAVASPLPPQMSQINRLLEEAEATLNTDRQLAASMVSAKNVLLPLLFTLGEAKGKPDQALPDFVAKQSLTQAFGNSAHSDSTNDGDAILPARAVQYPIAALGTHAVALGHLNSNPDVDGVIRSEPLLIRYYDHVFPALSLLIAAHSLNLDASDIRANPGREVSLGKLKIATDQASQMNTFFYRDHENKPAFQIDSFYDVLSGKIPPSKYQGKIVLIGATANGVGTAQVTPVSAGMWPVVSLASAVSSILQSHFLLTPEWGGLAWASGLLLIALYLTLLLPRLSAGVAALTTLCLLSSLLGLHFILMLHFSIWLQLMSAATLLVVGHILLTTKRFLMTERGKQKSEADSAESNRMLALAFQGQGQLDIAFDKFRKCPLDDALMANLYSLALDFERKRQFNKAESVFGYMAEHNPRFRDIEQRSKRVKAMSETVMLGVKTGSAGPGLLALDNELVEKPMLGRYQIEKELGKGAMGIVYLGRDPKLNRVVAIKTIDLSSSFDEAELSDVKTRFFREAETAGRLNHPHIVTMYDAGEEHDLAYIAMEFLKGDNLSAYTKEPQLLPLTQLMSIIARVAEALSYAHAHQVVHRDVKPANIMYEAQTDQVKVTDFGIARITDSSKTKTGMVLGTPSYMSPEQLSGKKIDGRSDLFSLGVTLYQMACGQLPFTGESMAQLMFKIANEKQMDIRNINPQVPEYLAAIIDRALSKDITQRYQTGVEMADDLRACMKETLTLSATVDLEI